MPHSTEQDASAEESSPTDGQPSGWASLADCQPELPADAVPSRFRFVELGGIVRASRIEGGAPEQMVLGDAVRRPGVKGGRGAAVKRAREWLESRTAETLGVAALPDDGDVKGQRTLFNKLRSRDQPAPRPRRVSVPASGRGVADAKVKESYLEWRNRQIAATARGELALRLPVKEGMTVDDVVGPLADELWSPDFSRPLPGVPQIALCTIVEQSWWLQGYARGELISSLSLAPGETLELSVFSWTKTSRRSSEELEKETEVRTAETSLQRDALTVVQETASQMNTSISAKGVIPIPKMPFKVEGDLKKEVTDSLQHTVDEVSERTSESASTVRENRKTKVEVSREAGVENRQRRLVANPNRCHTLNLNHFEIHGQYRVRTEVTNVRACLLIDGARPEFNLDYVLCHEHALTSALKSTAYLDGFDAARQLRALRIHSDLVRSAELERTVGEEKPAEATLDAVVKAVGLHRERVADLDDAIDLHEASPIGMWGAFTRELIAVTGFWLSLPAAVRGHLESAEVQQGAAAVRSLRELLLLTLGTYGEGLLDDPQPAKIRDVLEALGAPGRRIKDLVQASDFYIDDLGLRAALRSAWSTWRSDDEDGASGELALVQAEQLSARAWWHSTFEQLKCHLEEHWEHYAYAVWNSRDPAGQQRWVQGVDLGVAVELQTVGFVGDRFAFPIRDDELKRFKIDDKDGGDGGGDGNSGAGASPSNGTVTLEDVVAAARNGSWPETVIDVSLPTPSLHMEAVRGECSACEPETVEERAAQIRLTNARAHRIELDNHLREVDLSTLADDDSDALNEDDGS